MENSQLALAYKGNHPLGLRVATAIDQVGEGVFLKDACAACGLTLSMFQETLHSERELGVAYARAQENRADILVDEMLAIVDSDENPQKARNQYQARQWIASKLSSKKYGDRIDVNVAASISIDTALNEARARLRPVRDQQDIEDAIFYDSPSEAATQPTDKQSDAPNIPPAVPDIFG